MGPIEAAAAALFIDSLGLGLLIAVGGVGAIWLMWAAVRQWGPSHLQGPIRGFPVALVAIPLLVMALPVGCISIMATPHPQPESTKVMAAVEVPLRTPTDHADLLAMLRRFAGEGGLHVDDGTEQWMQFVRQAHAKDPPSIRKDLDLTINASVWRGANDDEMEISVDDTGHLGRAWLCFYKTEQPEPAAKLRLRLLAELRRRWPDVRDVPVFGNRSLPFADDLIWTGTAYAVKPEHLADYTK